MTELNTSRLQLPWSKTAWALAAIFALSSLPIVGSAQDAAQRRATTTSTSNDALAPLSERVQPGMTLESLRALVGRPADTIDTVGACGIMHTYEWESEELRVVMTGNRVSAVVSPGIEQD